jgi:hypothetical protein
MAGLPQCSAPHSSLPTLARAAELLTLQQFAALSRSWRIIRSNVGTAPAPSSNAKQSRWLVLNVCCLFVSRLSKWLVFDPALYQTRRSKWPCLPGRASGQGTARIAFVALLDQLRARLWRVGNRCSVQRGGRRGRRRGAGRSRCWSYVPCLHPRLPSIPGLPHFGASSSYSARGTLIGHVEMFAVMPLLELVCKVFSRNNGDLTLKFLFCTDVFVVRWVTKQ